MKLREKLISVALAVALVAAFVPCSGCVSGYNPTVLTSEDLQAYFGQPIDKILFGNGLDQLFGGISLGNENFNSSDPVVGVWRTTKEANPTWDYSEYRIYANGSFKHTSYAKRSSGWSTHVITGAWVYTGVDSLLAPFGYNNVHYDLNGDNGRYYNISMSPNNKNTFESNYSTYYRVNA